MEQILSLSRLPFRQESWVISGIRTHNYLIHNQMRLPFRHENLRVKGFEPLDPAWKADALPLSDTRYYFKVIVNYLKLTFQILQLQVPLQLPCYDFILVITHAR